MTEVPEKGVILAWEKKHSLLQLLNIFEILEKQIFSWKIYILRYSMTHVVKHSPSWETDPRAVKYKTSRLLWNSDGHYYIRKSP